jgi:hypothetical protein
MMLSSVAAAASAKRIVTAIFVCETFALSGFFHQLVTLLYINAIHSTPFKRTWWVGPCALGTSTQILTLSL